MKLNYKKNGYIVNLETIYKKDIDTTSLSYKEFVEINSRFFKFLFKEIVENSYIFKIPFKIGRFEVSGNKQKIQFENNKVKGLIVNWIATKKLWKEKPELKDKKQFVYYTNEKTNGIIYKFRWIKRNAFIKFKNLYNFKLTKNNKLYLYKQIEDGKEYIIKTKNYD